MRRRVGMARGGCDRKTKVSKFYILLTVEQNVGRPAEDVGGTKSPRLHILLTLQRGSLLYALDISMQEPPTVHVREGLKCLAQDSPAHFSRYAA